jgi:hypothetical protein
MDNILFDKMRQFFNSYYVIEEEDSEEEYEPESESEEEEEEYEEGLIDETLKIKVDEKGFMSLDLEFKSSTNNKDECK